MISLHKSFNDIFSTELKRKEGIYLDWTLFWMLLWVIRLPDKEITKESDTTEAT